MQYDPVLETEQARWARGVQQVHASAPDPSRLIHVMDSEADDYALFSELVQMGSRFVIRLSQDRRIVPESASGVHGKTKALLETAESAGTRVASVSARRALTGMKNQRRHLSRGGREAVLCFSATRVVLRRPTSALVGLPDTLPVHIVRVWEQDVPDGVEPLEWMLVTTEPIASPEQISRVIELYRIRWVIDEFSKRSRPGVPSRSGNSNRSVRLQRRLPSSFRSRGHFYDCEPLHALNRGRRRRPLSVERPTASASRRWPLPVAAQSDRPRCPPRHRSARRPPRTQRGARLADPGPGLRGPAPTRARLPTGET
jgi:hypothetical protein